MVVFEDYEEVEEWLIPLSYIPFWEAVADHNLFSIAERDHCDDLIASGTVKTELILSSLKLIACDKLQRRYDLPFRCQGLSQPYGHA